MSRATRQPSRIRKNDTVMVIAGKERGKTGKVLRVLRTQGRIVIERLNVVKRHQKSRNMQGPGGVVEKEAPIHVSNVMLMCEKANAAGASFVCAGLACRSGDSSALTWAASTCGAAATADANRIDFRLPMSSCD